MDQYARVEPSFVVNFAAQSMVAESWLYPDQWYQTNVVANVKLHEKIRQFSFLKKYVHVSTPEVYGSCSGNVTESAPFNPSTPYAASRAACDLHLLTFFKNYQFPVVFTRASLGASAAETGLGISHWYTDPEGLFALAILRRSDR